MGAVTPLGLNPLGAVTPLGTPSGCGSCTGGCTPWVLGAVLPDMVYQPYPTHFESLFLEIGIM